MDNSYFNDEPEAWEIDRACEDAHAVTCVQCNGAGCMPDECPRGDACDEPVLYYRHREWMHRGCIAAFEALIENREVA
jgi:hypothetical protein